MVAIGPLTNVAIAMNICPDWSSELKDFYIMGGNVSGEGNITLMGEFNFVCDPEAAKVVLENTKIPIKITPWETCMHSVKISYNDVLHLENIIMFQEDSATCSFCCFRKLGGHCEERSRLASASTPAANLLNAIEESVNKKRIYNHWITCDQLTIAWLLDDYATSFLEVDFPNQNFITKVDSFHATVELSGQHTRGQMIIDRRNSVIGGYILCMREINKDIYLEYLKVAFQ